ncbi:ANTH domain-containing protein [Gloeopeniophorella convolvens]|nr:ANTH domain-containing protein [Gloeopeniophorella convolvens]
MSSFEKVVKNACKPKPAPPKSKYLDPIIAATWSEDGAVHDVCKALSPRFREPNSIIVFKALIVLHTMIRNGATDNILQYLSSSEVLRLKNVSGGQWEGYNPPKNLQHYALYLDSRIRAYRDLKHDAIRVQSETNRDLRLSMSIEEDARRNRKYPPEDDSRRFQSSGPPSRSKTIMGRKLRTMTVEKGLLRETKVVQKMMDALIECRFYLDDLEDELTITALRMLVKDLLILFQAVNEGVINVLEHYFEMSHPDAEQALAIYRHFCKQAEYVVEYLGVAKKLQNLLNVPIPNLKHAPVSLVGALEEYINDPNFEQNRIEYKANKDAADKGLRNGRSTPKKTEKDSSTTAAAAGAEAGGSSSQEAPKAEAAKALTDFFSAIEEEQTTMFNPQTGSPTSNYFQQQATYNPFSAAGVPGASTNPFPQIQVQPQPTGFLQPQFTAVPGIQQPTNPFPGFQAQPTGFLQPQATGANPFRPNPLAPQATGFSPFGQPNPLQPAPTGTNPQPIPRPNGNPFNNAGNPNTFPSTNPFPSQSRSVSQPFSSAPSNQPNFTGFPTAAAPAPTSAFNTAPSFTTPARPASTPLAPPKHSSPTLQPLRPHQTGSRNPFGVPRGPSPPPVPRAPTLFELAHGAAQPQTQFQLQNQSQVQPQPTGAPSSTFSSIASSFLGGGSNGTKAPDLTTPSLNSSFSSSTTTSSPVSAATGSTFGDSLFSSLGGQQTGSTALSSQLTGGPLRPQTTGYTAGIKAFKPTSSFGATLLETLPPIPQSAPATPALGGGPAGAAGTSAPSGVGLGGSLSASSSPGLGTGATTAASIGLSGNFGLGTQPTGMSNTTAGAGLGAGLSPFGGQLRPQATGGGAANPFRASMFTPGAGSLPAFGGAGAGAGLFAQPTGLFGAAQANAARQQQQQQNGAASLI